MEVNGIPNVRTCILKPQEGMVVKSQKGFGELPETTEEFKSAITLTPTVAIVGAGPAGLEAAITLRTKRNRCAHFRAKSPFGWTTHKTNS